jgi:hypothetical protein
MNISFYIDFLMSYLFECVKKIAFLINNKDEQSKGEIRNILNRSYIHHLGQHHQINGSY